MNDDRTKADKAWEARQEAARYRIFNAATNAAEATDEADDEKYFAVLDQAGKAAEAAAAEITGYKTYADLLEALDTAANSPSTAHTASVGKLPGVLRRLCVSPKSNKIMRTPREQNFGCGTQRGLSRSSPGPRPDAIAAMAKLICSLGATPCPLLG